MIPKPTAGDRLLSTSECIKRLHINRSEWAREVAFDYYLAYERKRDRRAAS